MIGETTLDEPSLDKLTFSQNLLTFLEWIIIIIIRTVPKDEEPGLDISDSQIVV